MKEFVLDCSVTMAWCFEDEASPYAHSILDKIHDCRIIVPSLWHLEIVNVLSLAERKKRISLIRSGEFLNLLNSLNIEAETATHTVAFSQIFSLARTLGLTAYDACYLEICIRRRLPLATLDVQLKKAAQICKVGLFH